MDDGSRRARGDFKPFGGTVLLIDRSVESDVIVYFVKRTADWKLCRILPASLSSLMSRDVIEPVRLRCHILNLVTVN